MDSQINEIKELIAQAQNMVVFTGAGISTGAGIPDFRGPGGLYETVGAKYKLPSGESLFDIDYFKRRPKPFFDFTRELFETTLEPTAFHYLIARWEREGRINMTITQNIDGLHSAAGCQNVLDCHGSYQRATCQKCGRTYEQSDYIEAVLMGEIPKCTCRGVIKPDVVFFGEALPHGFLNLLQNPPKADLLVVLGTSLTVLPAASLALDLCDRTPSIIINREATDYDSYFDHVIHDDLEVVAKLLD